MMGRLLYAILLGLHPRSFRERFGEEMANIFDEQGRKMPVMALLLDGLVSLFRQWALRPTRPEALFSAAGPAQSHNIPLFHTFEIRPIRRSAFAGGVVLSAAFFGVATFAMSRGGKNVPRLVIGTRYPRHQVLGVERSSMEGEPTTKIKVSSPPVDPLYELAKVYFKIIRVLDVLDANQDRDISAWEMATATLALKKLDWDGDGRLSAEECGFSLGGKLSPKPDPAFVQRARLEFMRFNPVLATLDADHNGEISEDEIKSSSVALRALDKNHDGILTPSEVLPEAVHNRTAMILSRLDANRDGQISQAERAANRLEPLEELLQRADRNRDGVVTARELSKELQIRYEMHRQLERALQSAGIVNPLQDGRPPTARK